MPLSPNLGILSSLEPSGPVQACNGTALPFICITTINHLNAKLNPICHLLALLGAHHIFHVSGLMVKHRLH